MTHNLSFHRSLATSFDSKVDLGYWNTVLQLFDEKKYVEAIRGILHYLDKDIAEKYGNPSKTFFTIPHGSILVQLDITDTHLKIQAPFLNVTGSKLVPLLRQATQLNFSPLAIAQVVLENEQLHFKYECLLELCEPLKIYDVLREICIIADNYDDEFITKFLATHIREPQILPYTTEQKDKAWELVQLYAKETLEIYEQLENKRLNHFLWDVLVITLLKIDYLCAPQGNLRNDLSKTIDYLNSKEEYFPRLTAGRDFLKRLQSMPKETFTKDLYGIVVFVPYKYFNNLEGVRDELRYAYKTGAGEMKSNEHLGATFTFEFGILNLFYNNNMDNSIAEVLMTALENSSGKPVKESAQILYDAVHKIMTQDTFPSVAAPVSKAAPAAEPVKEKGFFSKIFGS